VEFYRFRIGSFRTVYASATSNTIDPYVEILDEFGNVIAEEDNGGSGFSELTADLSPGTYYLAVTTFQAGDYGGYLLQTDYQ
jgi:ribosomal protein S11